MEPVYSRLRAVMGEQGALYAYCDNSYIVVEPETLATVLAQAQIFFEKASMKIGYDPGKTELILPRGYDRDTFPYSLDDLDDPAPQVVPGLKACLGVPRHFANDQAFITDVLQDMGANHDCLLDLVEEISDEDPLASLRLLQVCGVSWFGHVLSAVPHSLVVDFARGKDEAVAAILIIHLARHAT
jgi:hypothetical protein